MSLSKGCDLAHPRYDPPHNLFLSSDNIKLKLLPGFLKELKEDEKLLIDWKYDYRGRDINF